MRRVACLVMLALGVAPLAAQNWVIPETGTASIRGTVTAANGSGPLIRAEVQLIGRTSRVVLTDAVGRYVFRDLPRGRYAVAARSNGYLTTGWGAREPGDRPRRFELRDGASRGAVDLALPAAGVIEVFATDEQDEPLEGVAVTATRYQEAGGRRSPVPSISNSLQQRNIETDDRGLVRLSDLPPGGYIVTASIRRPFTADATATGIASGVRRKYVEVSYPGPPLAATQLLSLALGQEVNVRIPMAAVPVARVAGRVLQSDGSPMPAGSVSLTPVEPAGPSARPFSAALPSTGAFDFSDVPAGSYVLEAGASILDQGVREHAAVPVEVPETGLADLTIRARAAARLHGRVVVDRGSSPAAFDPRRFVLMVRLANGRYVTAKPGDDRQVTIGGLAGSANRWLLQDQQRGNPQRWFLKEVRLDGRDVTSGDVPLRDGEDITGLEVVVTQHAARIRGTARDERGEAVSAYRVVVFAADRARWNDSRYVVVASADERGRFDVDGLPAGRYFAVALEDDSPDARLTAPESLRSLRSSAMDLTVSERDAGIVTVPFVTR